MSSSASSRLSPTTLTGLSTTSASCAPDGSADDTPLTTIFSASLAEIFVSRKSFVTLQTEMTTEQLTAEEMAQEVKRLTGLLAAAGRKDLLLRAIGVPLLEELRIEAARGELSRLVITDDYRFCLPTITSRSSCSPSTRRSTCCSWPIPKASSSSGCVTIGRSCWATT